MNIKSFEEKVAFKRELKEACQKLLEQRVKISSDAVKQLQEDANAEQKSSAGDKHETARAMAQIEIDMNAKQAEETKRQLTFLNSCQFNSTDEIITNGSIVETNSAIFFIAIGLGSIQCGATQVMTIAPASPLSAALRGKRAGDKFILNGKENVILTVF
jgi:hypothetical protein